MINVVIVDDEPAARRTLREFCEQEADFRVAGEFGDSGAALDSIRATRPDVLFLDIQMSTLNGMELARSLDAATVPLIVFVTAFDQYAVEAFELSAIDYLLKPFDRERFDLAWQRTKAFVGGDRGRRREQDILALLRELKAGPQYLKRLLVKTEGRVFFLDVDNIHFIEAQGNYVRVHNGAKSYMIRETIGGLESQLDPKAFLRIHRSTIVKIDRIKELQPWFHGEYHVVLENGKQLTLSRNYRANLQQAVGNAL